MSLLRSSHLYGGEGAPSHSLGKANSPKPHKYSPKKCSSHSSSTGRGLLVCELQKMVGDRAVPRGSKNSPPRGPVSSSRVLETKGMLPSATSTSCFPFPLDISLMILHLSFLLPVRLTYVRFSFPDRHSIQNGRLSGMLEALEEQSPSCVSWQILLTHQGDRASLSYSLFQHVGNSKESLC